MKSLSELGYADQGLFINTINRLCDWAWPLPPPTVRSVEVYYVYENPYDGVDSPHSEAIFGNSGADSAAKAKRRVAEMRANGFPDAGAAGPYIKFVSTQTGEVLY